MPGSWSSWGIFDKVLTVSALADEGCDALLEELRAYAVPGPPLFPG